MDWKRDEQPTLRAAIRHMRRLGSSALIVISTRATKLWRALLRPGTVLAGFVILSSSVGTILRSQDVPSLKFWQRGDLPSVTVTVLSVFSMFFTFLIVIGYRRSLQDNTDAADFFAACRSVWNVIRDETSIENKDLGVHIWTVTGFPGGRYMVNRATFKTTRHEPGPVRWTKGKGAIGKCWETGLQSLEDLDPLSHLTDPAFSELPPRERFGMTWQEYQQTREYRAIWVTPIFKGPAGNRTFGGCLSVDVTNHAQAAGELDRATQSRKHELDDILAFCNSILS